jgi:hypothetical protein
MLNTPIKIILLLLLCLISFRSFSQPTLKHINTIHKKIDQIQIDETGQLYALTPNNELIKYSNQFDSVTNYINISNGIVGTIDATNPLRILIYYPQYSKCIFLDRMLAPQKELDLRQLKQVNSGSMAMSQDGNLWLYDLFNLSIAKYDFSLNIIAQGNDLRQQLNDIPKPCYMVEKNRKVYLVDSTQGVFIFDQFGTFLNQLQFIGLKSLQIENDQIIYLKEGQIHIYNLKNFSEKTVDLRFIPAKENPEQALIFRNLLYVRYKNELSIFEIINN